MKTLLLGFEHVAGTSKENNAYDFSQLFVAVPIEQKPNHKSFGGMTFSKLSVDSSVLKSIKSLDFPCEVDVEMDQQLTSRGPRSVITAIKPV